LAKAKLMYAFIRWLKPNGNEGLKYKTLCHSEVRRIYRLCMASRCFTPFNMTNFLYGSCSFAHVLRQAQDAPFYKTLCHSEVRRIYRLCVASRCFTPFSMTNFLYGSCSFAHVLRQAQDAPFYKTFVILRYEESIGYAWRVDASNVQHDKLRH
jgi:hypothetical protein